MNVQTCKLDDFVNSQIDSNQGGVLWVLIVLRHNSTQKIKIASGNNTKEVRKVFGTVRKIFTSFGGGAENLFTGHEKKRLSTQNYYKNTVTNGMSGLSLKFCLLAKFRSL